MKRYPLFIQLMVSVLVTVLFLLGMVGWVYYQTSSTIIKQKTEDSTREALNQSSQFIASYIGRLKETTSSLAHHEQVVSYAAQGRSADKLAVAELFETILGTDKDLVAAVLVTKDGDLVATDPTLAMKTSSNMMAEAWYQQAIAEKAMPVLTPARREKDATSRDWVISVTQEVTAKDGSNLGVLRLDIAYTTLATYLDALNLGQDGFSFIVNNQHEFVYHPRKIVYSSNQEMAAMSSYLKVSDGYTEAHDAFVYQIEVPSSQWTLIGVASLDGLSVLEGQLLTSFLLTGLVAVILTVLTIWWLLRIWVKPLRDFRQVILKVGAGQSHLRANETGSEELVDLSRQFNKMLDEIDRLMLAVQDKEVAIRHYELAALSSQINPHFLYNTLDTIVWMAEFNDRDKVVSLTKSLAQYFRLALNKGNELISLADELAHVSQYLYIQKERYGDKLSYELPQLNELPKLFLPKLVLQPLVENAIYHGIKEVARPGKIVIKVTETANQVSISIWDNGKGILSEVERPTVLQLGGVGLKNVDERLRIHFGEAYQMTIQSEADVYTEIKLNLPKI